MPVSSLPPGEFPQLTAQNHTDTSHASQRYNCIAWAAGDDTRWWWPDAANIGYWPPSVERQETIAAFMQAYAVQGYRPCADGSFDPQLEKLAIYGFLSAGDIYPTHAARQLSDGKWTSKLGNFKDISHDTLDALVGPKYGSPVCYLSRPRVD